MRETRSATHRRYRLLARAYPPGPRRAELLDTMLLAAEEAGRRRPAVREILDVLRHAPRARLGRPGSRAVVPVAVVVALLSGFVTASLAARLVGETDRPLPTATDMAGIAALVTPGVLAPTLERHDRVFVNGNGEAQFSQVRYQADHVTPIPDLRSYDADVADRLTAVGWRLGPTSFAGHTDLRTAETLTAAKDGWVLTFANNHQSLNPTDGGWFEVSVRRAEPASLPAAFAAGGLLGTAIGWLLAGWASRRSEHHPAASGVLALLAVVAGGSAVFMVIHVVRDYLAVLKWGFATHEGPIWSWLVLGDEGQLLLAPTMLAAVVAIVILALCRPHRAGPSSRPSPVPRVSKPIVLATFGLVAISTVACTGFSRELVVIAVLMAIAWAGHLGRTRKNRRDCTNNG
ncbi:hypothetical protein GA0070558_11760 [Micromonospora haikouensis]|uniref:Uncharacterized protein n=1 Tax=Micromonospora haikouensis TaxID=686309 RepID=A0A1C4WQ36_9ACTN|nr:hypothetical protein [Micromonospora haikouensis]SCE98302.1 hypothetical protein GA0070558_11760 [Micromonospora haikouensis]